MHYVEIINLIKKGKKFPTVAENNSESMQLLDSSEDHHLNNNISISQLF